MTEPDIDQTISISTENHTDGVLIAPIELPVSMPGPSQVGDSSEIGVTEGVAQHVEPVAETPAQILVEETDVTPTAATPPSNTSTTVFSAEDRVRAKARKQQIKEAKFLEILKYVEAHGEVSNDEVEKLVSVSDTTAAKYLKELVKIGKLQKIGRGWQTKYIERNPTS